MIVHANEAGNHRAPGEVHAQGAGGDGNSASLADLANFAALDENGLVGEGGSAGAVDEAHMLEGHDGPIDADETFGNRRERGSLLRRETHRHESQEKNSRKCFWHDCARVGEFYRVPITWVARQTLAHEGSSGQTQV